MPSLKVCLLGPPHVELEGVVLELGGHKNTALVAYLAATGQSHSREVLATLLWPELDASRGRANLRRSLSELRRALREEYLISDRETVGLDPRAEIWVDVIEFRRLAQSGRGHSHSEAEACDECAAGLTAAIELYREDFLAGFGLLDSVSFDDWQFFETEGLRQELGSALERMVGHLGARGATQEAIRCARRWLALDPLHEPVHRRLMWLYAKAGQRSGALRQYAECERVLCDELGVSPEEETTALHAAIRERRVLAQAPQVLAPPPPPASSKHNLPVQPIAFVGREAMLAEIGERLGDPSCRLLTLVGSGGSGKTRLALETAGRHLDAFKDGVSFVGLAPLQSADAIVPTVFQALGLPVLAGGDPRQQLLSWLREKNLLLVFDNFEHLLAGQVPGSGDGAGLVADVLAAAPGVKVLATSRAALKLQDEHLFPVGGMDYPGGEVEGKGRATPGEAGRYSAIRLFVQGARQVEPAFELTADNVADVSRVCSLVDGMPLGILLATAWVRMLTPGEIAVEVSRSLDFLKTNMRDVPERQRSLRAVFDHSWGLLNPREREVMQALSEFRGGFTREAAAAVTGVSLATLLSLVDKSFLGRSVALSPAPRRRGRYEVHELLRQYAAEQLAQEPASAERIRDQHSAYFASALRRWASVLKGPRQEEALAELDVEIDNARVAWDWAVERGQVARLDEALEGVCRFYELRLRREEGEAACCAAAGPPLARDWWG